MIMLEEHGMVSYFAKRNEGRQQQIWRTMVPWTKVLQYWDGMRRLGTPPSELLSTNGLIELSTPNFLDGRAVPGSLPDLQTCSTVAIGSHTIWPLARPCIVGGAYKGSWELYINKIHSVHCSGGAPSSDSSMFLWFHTSSLNKRG